MKDQTYKGVIELSANLPGNEDYAVFRIKYEAEYRPWSYSRQSLLDEGYQALHTFVIEELKCLTIEGRVPTIEEQEAAEEWAWDNSKYFEEKVWDNLYEESEICWNG